MTLLTVSLVLFAVTAAVSSQMIFKSWVNTLGSIPFSLSSVVGIVGKILTTPIMLLGLVLYGLGFLAWILILSRVSLSLVYPVVLSLNIISILVLSNLLFHEAVSPLQIVGVVVIVGGIFLVFSA